MEDKIPSSFLYLFIEILCFIAFIEKVDASPFTTNQLKIVPPMKQSLPPPLETLPPGGVIGQPRRVTEAENKSKFRHQGKWGNFNFGNGEFAGFGPVGVYGLDPWAEDWSDKKDKKNWDDPFDALKAIKLNDSGSIYLTISGETRIRNWFESNPLLGSLNKKNSSRFTSRNLYGVDLHVGDHFRFFGQLNNAEAAGWHSYGYDTTWRHQLIPQQFFGEFKYHWAGANWGLMVGRQQFLDAPSWLLYDGGTPDVPLVWNGVRGYSMWKNIRFDLFDFIGTDWSSTALMKSGVDYGTRLYGAHITISLPQFSIGHETIRSFFDLFWMGFRFHGGKASVPLMTGMQTGTQTRQNIGFRWYGNAADFEYDLSGDYQRGHFNATGGFSRPVEAWAGVLIAGWRPTGYSFHPFVGVQAEIYSGSNSQHTRGMTSTFAAPFSPETMPFDATMTFIRSNLASVGPLVSMTPKSFINIRLHVPFLWRENINDGVYSSFSRFNFLSGEALHKVGSQVGAVPQVRLKFQVNQHLAWTMDGGAILMTHRMQQAGAHNGEFMLSTGTFRF